MSKNLFFLTGNNEFELFKFFQQWKKNSQSKYGDFNVTQVDFENEDLEKLLSEIVSPPFFGDRRIFFVKNFPPSAGKKNINNKKTEKLLSILEDIPKENVVIFINSNPDRRTKFFKKITEISEIKKFGKKTGVQLLDWIENEFKNKKAKILPAAKNFLIQYCGEDQQKLQSEIRKLIHFFSTKKAPISEIDIEKICIPYFEVINFEFSRAVQTGNFTNISKVLEKMVDAGEDAIAIFNRDLVTTLRQIIKIRDVIDKNIFKENSKVHPFVFQNLRKTTSLLSLEKWKNIYQKILQIDINTKTGKLAIFENPKIFLLEIEKIFLPLIENIAIHSP